MIVKRPRVKHEKTFEERLAEEAVRFRDLAAQTPPGAKHELYLRRARQAEAASHINEWLKSPSQLPKHDEGGFGTLITRAARQGPV